MSAVLLLVCSSSVLAQNRYNLSQFRRETSAFVKQPARWRGDDWLKLGLVAAGTALVMQADQPIRDAVLRDRGRYYRSVPIEAGRLWGEWYTVPLVIGAFAAHERFTGSPASKKIEFEMLQSVLYANGITQTLKIAVGRSRPYRNEGAFSFHPFVLSSYGRHSLPGGHNTNAWAMSTVLARNTHSTGLKIVAYAPAVLTFVSRVYQDQHWTSDDFLGAAIGVLVGSWVVGRHEQKESAVQLSAIGPCAVSIRF
jgi:hypothetical protein